MLNSITNQTLTHATQAARDSLAVVPPVLLQNDYTDMDVYERSDGTTATRFDTAAQPQANSAEDPRFRELLHQFIGQTFIGQMLKSMRATQEKNPYFHGGHAEDMYQSLLDMELTDQLTQATSRTLSEPMYKLMMAPKVR
jgi:Rod binding domain-containing protein